MLGKEWHTTADPKVMLEFVGSTATDRKLRLFATACCRRAWHLLNDEQGRAAVVIGEECADGVHTLAESFAIGQELNVFECYEQIERLAEETGVDSMAINYAFFAAGLTTGWLGCAQAFSVAKWVARAITLEQLPDAYEECENEAARHFEINEHAAQALIVRDIFADPFQEFEVDPVWLTPSILGFAEEIYDSREFDRMRELANVLEAAGCQNAAILEHCRQPDGHVRGCWAVDLILGKM